MFSCLHCLPDNHSNVWEKDGEENTDDDGRRVDSHHVPQSWDSWKMFKEFFLNDLFESLTGPDCSVDRIKHRDPENWWKVETHIQTILRSFIMNKKLSSK